MREFAYVFTRMPNHATLKLPRIPTTLKSRMMPTLIGSIWDSTPKYRTMIDAMKTSSSTRNRPWVIR